MKKSRRIILVVGILLALILSYTLVAYTSDISKTSLGKEIISDITQNKYGNIKVSDTSNYDELFEEDILGFKDDSYIYLLASDAKCIKAIMPVQTPNKPLFDPIKSSSKAKEHALSIALDASPQFFEKDYDIFIDKIGESDKNSIYSIEIWQKIDKKVYTGTKISIMITANGYLDLLVTRDTGFTNQISKNLISEKEAINIAYSAVENTVTKLESQESNMQTEGSELKPEDEPVVSDAFLAGLEKSSEKESSIQDPYNIKIYDRDAHAINTYMEYDNGNMYWIIQISNVQTNRKWGHLDFFTKINAVNGDVELISSTR
ncbi:hypothetical protein ES707_20178 [subsurface metagenome]